jgi:zinc transport system substrate-binding protein
MNRSVASLFIKVLAAGLLAASCVLPRIALAQSKPLVVVSVPVLGLIAREIGGSDIEVHQLLQGDASPHDYAMKFSDRRALAQARRVFWIAPALESFLVEPLSSQQQSVVLFGTLPESDAHIWFAPARVRDSARVMAQHFSQLKPEAAAAFSARLAAFDAALTSAARKLDAQLPALKTVQLIVGHDAYAQLTGSIGMPQALAVLQQIQTAASAQRIAALERQINAGGNFCVIEERNHPLPVARQLAQRHKLPLVVIDVYAARASSYAGWLDELGQALGTCGGQAR